MIDEVGGTGGTHIGRRTLLKRAGAAGALGLAAPIAFDSFFSPAAACSGDDIAAERLTSWNDAEDLQGAGTTLQSPSSITTVNGSLIVIAFNLYWNGTANNPPTTVTASSPAFGTANVLDFVQYETVNTNDFYRLYVFTAQGNGASGQVTVNVTNSSSAGRVSNFTAQVLEFTSTPQPGIPTSPDQASGTGATATVSLAPAPASTAGQLLVVGGHPNNVTSGDWSVPAAFPSGSQLDDTFSDDGSLDVSLASFYDPIANTGNVSSTFSGSAAITSAATWGAVTVEINC